MNMIKMARPGTVRIFLSAAALLLVLTAANTSAGSERVAAGGLVQFHIEAQDGLICKLNTDWGFSYGNHILDVKDNMERYALKNLKARCASGNISSYPARFAIERSELEVPCNSAFRGFEFTTHDQKFKEGKAHCRCDKNGLAQEVFSYELTVSAYCL